MSNEQLYYAEADRHLQVLQDLSRQQVHEQTLMHLGRMLRCVSKDLFLEQETGSSISFIVVFDYFLILSWDVMGARAFEDALLSLQK